MAVKVNQDIVGHVPHKILKVLSYVIKNGGMVDEEWRHGRWRSLWEKTDNLCASKGFGDSMCLQIQLNCYATTD